MTTLAHDVPNILDISTRYTSDGKPLPIAKILTKRKPVFKNIPWQEANTTNGHKISVETELPTAVLRKLNQGVKPSTGRANTITEATASFASLGQVDKELAELSTNVADFRVQKNGRHIEAIGQAFEDQFFNGSAITPGGFVGLKERYNSLSGVLTRQVINCAGTGSDLTSMFIVGWGEESVSGIYAKGTKAGIQHTDYGDLLVDDGNGGKYPALQDWFALNCGIMVQEPRNIVRVCNIDQDALKAVPVPGTDLILVNELIKATHRIEYLDMVNAVIYVNRDIHEWLDLQASNRTILALKHAELDGKMVVMFRGIPIERTDSLGWNEDAVA
jgi:hypothetical protein